MAHAIDHLWRRDPRSNAGREINLALGLAALAVVVTLRLTVFQPESAAAAPVPSGADIVGEAQLNDGGLFINGEEVRLSGVELPALEARCGDVECGLEARRALHLLVADHRLACRTEAMDGAAHVATCWVGGRDLGAELVRQGHAKAVG